MAGTHFVVDKNIPFATDALAGMGRVTVLPSSRIDAAAVRDADVLWVRSTTKVGPALLDGSRVKFVATATIGTDHLDIDHLAARGIGWASAPGSNAASVQLWWAAAVLTYAEHHGVDLARMRLGIVGVGHVGRKIEAFAGALGVAVLRCDPPRARAEGAEGFVALEDVLRLSDIVTLHVPLTRQGTDATWHLMDAARLAALHDGGVLVNASRGPVVDASALCAMVKTRPLVNLLDVYEGEPAVPPALVETALLATPHIAGHSLDGKVNGTRMVYEATCAFLGVPVRWSPRRSLPPAARAMCIDTAHLTESGAVLAAVRRCYKIEDDDAALRRVVRLPERERGAAFQRLRDEYPEHRELAGVEIELMPRRPRAAAALEALGARVVER